MIEIYSELKFGKWTNSWKSFIGLSIQIIITTQFEWTIRVFFKE